MPILAQEPALYPEELFDDPSEFSRMQGWWWVLHARPRQEKSLARQLRNARIPFFLPLIPHRWRSRGQTLTSYNPLFPGYVFLWADRDGRLAALATKRVVRSLEVTDQDRLWQDLRQIRRLITSGAPVSPEHRLVPGAAVEIRSGPLSGLRGKILQGASGRRFVVQVDFIQRGASVLLDDYTLNRIDGALD